VTQAGTGGEVILVKARYGTQRVDLTMKTSVFICISLASLLLHAAPDSTVAKLLELSIPSAKPKIFERVEISVGGMPASSNPFDPEAVALDLEVTAPSGKQLRMPGFRTQDFERKLEGKREVLTARENGRWCLRWLPLETGRHALLAMATVTGPL
jgi:hypothetical protein